MVFEKKKVVKFTDSIAWREAHELVLGVYKISKNFPAEEQFCLTSQIRRAVVSISSNIAEGFSRKSVKEKTQFLRQALGSLTEVQNQLLIAKDIGYTNEKSFKDMATQTATVGKLINSLIQYTQSKLTKH